MADPFKAKGFRAPTQLPENETVRKEWQALNKAWWEATPMRYDWDEAIEAEPESPAYFEEIDRRFFGSVRHYMPWRERPFDPLIPFSSLRDRDVLEIGVGHGSHAQLIAPFCKSFTGIDLTQKGSHMTARRLELFDIPGRILCMDAESLSFPDASFDFIWSWGVIHHSAHPLRILREMRRVLRPGGRATVMVYHRSFCQYYFLEGFLRGVLCGELWRKASLHHINQAATDGALARYYRPKEWQRLCEGLFEIKHFFITGQKTDVIPLPAGRLKKIFECILPDALSRSLTHALKMGSFLIAEMKRKD